MSTGLLAPGLRLDRQAAALSIRGQWIGRLIVVTTAQTAVFFWRNDHAHIPSEEDSPLCLPFRDISRTRYGTR